jgi:16S rRNA (guanine527-N7)-methyltransferase
MDDHAGALGDLGLQGAALDRLRAYLDLVSAWSRRVNLTGARTARERTTVLVGDVLPARSIPEPGRLIDVGSGNGSPGLVLAVLRDDLQVTLLEPRRRRWAFLREAARVTGVRVDVRRERHDGYAGPPARSLTLRALALPAAQLVPLLEPGGRLVVFGGSLEAGPAFRREDVDAAAAAAGVRVFRLRR